MVWGGGVRKQGREVGSWGEEVGGAGKQWLRKVWLLTLFWSLVYDSESISEELLLIAPLNQR